MEAKQVVQEFCDSMVKRDAEALRPYLADDVVYQNTGMPAASGIEDVIANLAGQFAMFPDSYEYKTHQRGRRGRRRDERAHRSRPRARRQRCMRSR